MEEIKKDVQEAVREGKKSLASSLKYLYSLLQAQEAREGDFQPIKILQKEMKAKKEALKMFEKAGRQDLVENEKEEIRILQKYLPEMMSEEEIEAVVVEVMSKLKAPSFGQVMGMVMAKVKGKAEGSKVAQVVKNKLKDNRE